MHDKEAGRPVIAAAVGSASNKSGLTGAAIEQAMAEAGLAAMQEGITDPEVIRERKLAARQALKDAAAAKATPPAKG